MFLQNDIDFCRGEIASEEAEGTNFLVRYIEW